MFGQEIKKVLPTTTLALLFSGSYFNSKKMELQKKVQNNSFFGVKSNSTCGVKM